MHARAAATVYDLTRAAVTTGSRPVYNYECIPNRVHGALPGRWVGHAGAMLPRRALLTLCVLLVAAFAGGPASVVPAPVAESAPLGAYGWPVAGWPRLARPFDPPLSTFGAGHRGVDLVGSVDLPILSAGAGVVVFAGELAGRGVVSVQHPDGLRTTYEPVSAQVTPGSAVERGQPLGVLQAGHAGCPAAACLHWGVRRGEVYLDPLRLIGRWPVRLKPWEP